MENDIFSEEIKQLTEFYKSVQVAISGNTMYARIKKVTLPKGCTPKRTGVLLELTSKSNRPILYAQPGIKLPNGKEPRSTSVVEKEGESWLQYSYQFEWIAGKHSLVQFVEAALRRFAKDE